MRKFLAICQNTFVQTIRQPIYGILIIVTFAILALQMTMAGWTMASDYVRADLQLMHEFGLSTILFLIGVLLAAFSASSVLSREIEDRTALTVISKPVSRGTFVLGKFAGVSAAVTVAFYLCAIAFLMTVRYRPPSTAAMEADWPVVTLGLLALFGAIFIGLAGNYLFGWHFTSAAVWSALVLFTVAIVVLLKVGKGWQIVPLGYDAVPSPTEPDTYQLITPERLIDVMRVFMATLILCAIAVAAGTRLGQIATLLICLGVWALGSIHPYLSELAQRWPVMKGLTWVIPNLTYFYSLDSDKPVPLVAAAAFAAYGLVYVAAVLSLGIALFQTRQLESQESSSTMPGVVGLLAWMGRLVAIGVAIWAVNVLGLFPKSEEWLNQEHHVTRSFLLVSGFTMLAFAAGTWLIWGSFSRGMRWAYWTVLTIAALALLYSGTILFVPQVKSNAIWHSGTQLIVAAVISAFVLLILVLPRTRRHFEFHLRKRITTEAQRTQR